MVMALFGGFIELLMVFVLSALAYGATRLGRTLIHAVSDMSASIDSVAEEQGHDGAA